MFVLLVARPGSQSLHRIVADEAENLPSPQKSHTEEPAPGCCVPSGHAGQSVLPFTGAK